MKDVSGVAGTRFREDGRMDERTHTETGEGHFYSLPPPASDDKKNNLSLKWRLINSKLPRHDKISKVACVCAQQRL